MADFKKLSKFGLKARWAKVHLPVVNHINQNHRSLLVEKARLIGFIMGDGSLTCRESHFKKRYSVLTFYPDDERMLKLFLSDLEKLYLKKPRVKNLGKYYSVRADSKPAWEDLRTYGDFSSLNWEFPKRLKSKVEKIEWLRAIFDCESYVGKKDIRIQSVSKKGVYSIQKLLNEFGITSKTYKYKRKNKNWNVNYILSIMGKENIKKYSDLIGFNHSKKQIKLKNMPACQNG